MGKTLIKIGPADHGRPMSLAEFEHAKVQEGYLYELSRGIITVSDVPKRRHMLQLDRDPPAALQSTTYLHPGRIAGHPGRRRMQAADPRPSSPNGIPTCRDLPDRAAADRQREPLAHWIPEIVIEVVSPSSRKRDYEEKPEEYLRLGVKEYWIVDGREQGHGRDATRAESLGRDAIEPPAIYRTRLLPGLEFSCEAVFRAAGLI